MKILAFAGSNSSTSINKKLATYAARQFKGAHIEILDLNDYPLPLFSVDVEKQIGQPEKALAFLAKIAETDFIVLSLAENNANYNVGFKNIFDWASRTNPKPFQGKPMLLMATSPGKRGGASVLEIAKNALPRYGADIKAIFSLPLFNENFDTEKGIVNEDLNNQLMEIIDNL
jgi:chromate reductase